MIDRIDTHPTTRDVRYVERRSGNERRKIHTMLDPQVDRRKGTRRAKKETAPARSRTLFLM